MKEERRKRVAANGEIYGRLWNGTYLIVNVLQQVVLQGSDGILDAQIGVRPQQRLIRCTVADEQEDTACICTVGTRVRTANYMGQTRSGGKDSKNKDCNLPGSTYSPGGGRTQIKRPE